MTEKMISAEIRLEEELSRDKKELETLNTGLKQPVDFSLGNGSSGMYSWEMAFARSEQIGKRIADLENALTRVAEGAYGRCTECGQTIEPERLEIVPTTTLCSQCARTEAAKPRRTRFSRPPLS